MAGVLALFWAQISNAHGGMAMAVHGIRLSIDAVDEAG